MINNFSSHGIKGSSQKFKNADQVPTKEYDLVIVTSSWDDRCLISTELSLSTKKTMIIFYDDRDKNGYRDKNDQKIKAFANKISNEILTVEGISTDFDKIWFKILGLLKNELIKSHKNLRIFFDLTCSPRYQSLATLSFLLRSGFGAYIDFFYAEGLYPKKNLDPCKGEVEFTTGAWQEMPIPGYVEFEEPSLKKQFVVSVGFEGAKTLKVLNKQEPNNVAVVAPNPGFTADYYQRTKEANSELYRIYKVDDNTELPCPAGDAVSVWKTLNTFLPVERTSNDFLLCAGSKPHSLGLALTALSRKGVNLLFCAPKSHEPVYIEPSGPIWIYNIRNLQSYINV